jgi:hypothetical protein
MSLTGSIKPNNLMTLLSSVTACIVSKAQDARLREVEGVDGWARYRWAKPTIGVYDQKKKCWRFPRSGEKALDLATPPWAWFKTHERRRSK